MLCQPILFLFSNFKKVDICIYKRIRKWPVTGIVFEGSYSSGWNLVQWLMSRNRDWCKVFESRTVADVSYIDWHPLTVTGVKYLKIRVTRRQPLHEKSARIFDGHYTRSLGAISVTGHWRILSYVSGFFF